MSFRITLRQCHTCSRSQLAFGQLAGGATSVVLDSLLGHGLQFLTLAGGLSLKVLSLGHAILMQACKISYVLIEGLGNGKLVRLLPFPDLVSSLGVATWSCNFGATHPPC